MADEDTFTCPPHSIFVIMLLQPPQSVFHRRIFFGLILFRTKGVVAERKQADGGLLSAVKGESVLDGYGRELMLGRDGGHVCWNREGGREGGRC
jgi:hypothetical protein